MTLCGQFMTGICLKITFYTIFILFLYCLYTILILIRMPNWQSLNSLHFVLSQTYIILTIQLKNKTKTRLNKLYFQLKRNFIGTSSVFDIQHFNSYNLCLVFTAEDLYMYDLRQDNQYILLWAIIPGFGILLQHLSCSFLASWNSYNPRFIRREFQPVPQTSGYKLYRT